jgi:ATP-binding cassette subfamily B (MDR/TAP) protein 1
MNTHVGAGGNQLSGGQKQRLALARAFVKKPKMFIFDEATSALDKNNEKSVQQAINSIQGVTVIVIAHRLSTVRNADKILVMGKGELKEEGSHDELLLKYPNGVYAKLVENE